MYNKKEKKKSSIQWYSNLYSIGFVTRWKNMFHIPRYFTNHTIQACVLKCGDILNKIWLFRKQLHGKKIWDLSIFLLIHRPKMKLCETGKPTPPSSKITMTPKVFLNIIFKVEENPCLRPEWWKKIFWTKCGTLKNSKTKKLDQ